MTAITRTLHENVVLLELSRPPVNALDVDTLEEFSDALDRAREEDVDAVVLTGTGAVFSAGADLPRVLAGDAAYVEAGIDALSRNFRTLFTFPRPVVAAINGHALAGGCIIACASDHRVMGRTGRIGALELTAGVPFPSWALEVVRHSVPAGHFDEVILLARAYEPSEALRLGLIDETVDDERVLERAIEIAQKLALVPRMTYATTKGMVRRPTVEAAERAAADTDDQVKAAWNSTEVRAAIKRQMDALRGS